MPRAMRSKKSLLVCLWSDTKGSSPLTWRSCPCVGFCPRARPQPVPEGAHGTTLSCLPRSCCSPQWPPGQPRFEHILGKSSGRRALGAAEGQSPASVHCFCSFECQEGTSAGEGKRGISPSTKGIRDKHTPAARWGAGGRGAGGGCGETLSFLLLMSTELTSASGLICEGISLMAPGTPGGSTWGWSMETG